MKSTKPLRGGGIYPARLARREVLQRAFGLEQASGQNRPQQAQRQRFFIAVGHPFAATGGRIVASLAKMLEEKGSGRGLIPSALQAG